MKFNLVIFIILFVIGCRKTSTPKEYLNQYRIDQTDYENDRRKLADLIKTRYDSVIEFSTSRQGKCLEVYIDTIFHNPYNKIVFLTITKKENRYAMNDEGISYSGECHIGIIENKSRRIQIIDQLKYSSTSDELDGFDRVQKSIRNIYLTEMEFINKEFNINDERFWTSNVWKNKE